MPQNHTPSQLSSNKVKGLGTTPAGYASVHNTQGKHAKLTLHTHASNVDLIVAEEGHSCYCMHGSDSVLG